MKKLLAMLLTLVSISVFGQVNGAGATFPAPLYAKWASEYAKETGVKINYQSVGSGAGIKQIEARTVAFGASDMPLKDDRLKELDVIQFPTVIGGVVPVVNLKGIEPGQLKLSGQVLGDIYLGKIKRWNDPAIKALNPTLSLPDADLLPVRRADGSGTTFIWTNYISKVNTEFKEKIGDGTAVNWIVGAGGKGNEGVAAMVMKLPNTIGYVEYAYVKQNKMNYAQVQNASGTWVSPTEDAFKAAAAGADWNKTFYHILTNQPGKDTWPISGATFILMPLKSDKPEQAVESIKFFTWALEKGGKMADDLDYVALPKSVVDRIKQEMARVK
jgi:phosphate transport system substrate-binding protein